MLILSNYSSARIEDSDNFKALFKNWLLSSIDFLTLSQLYSSAKADGYSSFPIDLDQAENASLKELSMMFSISNFVKCFPLSHVLGCDSSL